MNVLIISSCIHECTQFLQIFGGEFVWWYECHGDCLEKIEVPFLHWGGHGLDMYYALARGSACIYKVCTIRRQFCALFCDIRENVMC